MRSAIGTLLTLTLLAATVRIVLISPGSKVVERSSENTSAEVAPVANSPHDVSAQSQLLQERKQESRLFVISEIDPAEPSSLIEVDLLTGAEIPWEPPEPLVKSDPVVLENYVVVLGQSGAWAGELVSGPNPKWVRLGAANRVLNSSELDHAWLRTNADSSAPANSRYLWTEVDPSGAVTQSHFRQRTLELGTPEIKVGPGPGIFALNRNSTGPSDVWSMMSERGIVIASGSTDLVASECGSFLECERTWYDPSTGEPRSGLYSDLADNIDTRFGAMLSPGGRYVASEISSSKVEISTVASNREIANACQWDAAIKWSMKGDLLACTTSEGLGVYFTPSGQLLALLGNDESDWSNFAFIS